VNTTIAVEIIVLDKNTISVDGDLYYHNIKGVLDPYLYFDMVKIGFCRSGDMKWDDKYKFMTIPIRFVIELDNITKQFFLLEQCVYLLKKDSDFVTKLHGKYVGGSSCGPLSAPSAFSINSNGKMPKVIKTSKWYWYYDQKLYNKYEQH